MNFATGHSGYAGRTISQMIAEKLDKRAKALHRKESERERGRCEGMAAALGVLRSTSMAEEIERSSDRLGFSWG